MTDIDINSTHPKTELLMAEIRMRRQANELSRQRDRIFELKRKLKVLANVISRKHQEIEELRHILSLTIIDYEAYRKVWK